MRKALIIAVLATLLLSGCANTQSYRSAGSGVYYDNPVVNVGFGSYIYPWHFGSNFYTGNSFGYNYNYNGYGYRSRFLSRRPHNYNNTSVYWDAGMEWYLNPPYRSHGTPPDSQSEHKASHNGKQKAPVQVANLYNGGPDLYRGSYSVGGVSALRPSPIVGKGHDKWAPPQMLQRVPAVSGYRVIASSSSKQRHKKTRLGKSYKRGSHKSRGRSNYRSKGYSGSKSYGGGRSSGGGHSSRSSGSKH